MPSTLASLRSKFGAFSFICVNDFLGMLLCLFREAFESDGTHDCSSCLCKRYRQFPPFFSQLHISSHPKDQSQREQSQNLWFFRPGMHDKVLFCSSGFLFLPIARTTDIVVIWWQLHAIV